MQRRLFLLGLALYCGVLSWTPPVWAADAKAATDDLILPMPAGQSMVLRPIYIGAGDAPFAARRFMIGDPSGGFKEYPTAVALDGAFAGQRQGVTDRLYYLGKYEVTEAQYYALMEKPPNAPPELKASQLPVRELSWMEAVQFIDRYNQWLFMHALDTLPKSGETVGFLRLPTEIEWEFAARGGAAVEPDVFDQRLPYPDSLAKYEWYAGPKSSHNKVKQVGLLAPNLLGLHDTLGNVAEMTHSLYQVEYYQGRVGGFVAKGGHYLTAEQQLRASLRVEEPFYLARPGQPPAPNRKATLGFRLALSAVVYPDRDTAQAMAQAWEQYRGGQGASLPAAVSVSSTSAQTQVQRQDSLLHLTRLKQALAQQKLSEPASQAIGLLEASLTNIKVILQQAEADSAFAWIKISAERGFFVYRELQKLPALQGLMDVAKDAGRTAMVERYEARMAEFRDNIAQALGTYSDSLRQLTTLDTAAIEAGVTRYQRFLTEHQAAEQLRILSVVQKHFTRFHESKRADREAWQQDFAKLAAQP